MHDARCCSSTCVSGRASTRELVLTLRLRLRSQMKGAEVTDEMLSAVGDMQLVESVTLLSGAPDNGFTCAPRAASSPLPLRALTFPSCRHTNMYVDDTGSLKGLPDNHRAAGLAAAAGHPCAVHGDAFVGRTIDSDDAFERLDFTLAEVRCAAAVQHPRASSTQSNAPLAG